MSLYTFKKLPAVVTFTCARCKREKTSKNVADAANGDRICNGCYGELISKGQNQ